MLPHKRLRTRLPKLPALLPTRACSRPKIRLHRPVMVVIQARRSKVRGNRGRGSKGKARGRARGKGSKARDRARDRGNKARDRADRDMEAAAVEITTGISREMASRYTFLGRLVRAAVRKLMAAITV